MDLRLLGPVELRLGDGPVELGYGSRLRTFPDLHLIVEQVTRSRPQLGSQHHPLWGPLYDQMWVRCARIRAAARSAAARGPERRACRPHA